jgi:hypothetical protein
MFDIKKQIKKGLCLGFGRYKDNKYGVPYINLILGIAIWCIAIALTIYGIYVALVFTYTIIMNPVYAYNLLIVDITRIIYDEKVHRFVGGLIGITIIAYALYILGVVRFLNKNALVCDRLQPSPEVKQIYDTIMALDAKKKSEFQLLLDSIATQISKDIRNKKGE